MGLGGVVSCLMPWGIVPIINFLDIDSSLHGGVERGMVILTPVRDEVGEMQYLAT